MKKLFQLSPLLELTDYHTLKMIGSYNIEHIDQHKCIFQHEAFSISIEAKELDVKALQQEQIIVLIDDFQKMTVQKMKPHG